MFKKYSTPFYSLFFVASLWTCSKTGSQLPAFEAKTLNGKEINSQHLKGKIVVIKLWATWCGPCRNEIPELNELCREFSNDTNIVFLAITDDKPETIKAFLDRTPFYYQHITNAETLKNRLHSSVAHYIPEHLVISPNGEIVFDQAEPEGDIKSILRDEIMKLRSVSKF